MYPSAGSWNLQWNCYIQLLFNLVTIFWLHVYIRPWLGLWILIWSCVDVMFIINKVVCTVTFTFRLTIQNNNRHRSGKKLCIQEGQRNSKSILLNQMLVLSSHSIVKGFLVICQLCQLFAFPRFSLYHVFGISYVYY